MTNNDYKKLKELSKNMSILRNEQINAVSKVAKAINESSVTKMVEQINLTSKMINNSHRLKALDSLSNSVLAVSSLGLDVSKYEPLFESLVELSKVTSSPSYLNTMKELSKIGNFLTNTMQIYYDSPSYRAMIDAFSNIDSNSMQTFVDSIPEDISSDVKNIENEIENDPEAKATFQPILDSMEEVLSSQVGAEIDFSKTGFSKTSINIFLYILVLLFQIYAPNWLIPDPTDVLVDETKRHHAVIEKDSKEQLEINKKSLEIQQEQLRLNKEQLELDKHKHKKEIKKDSK
ncbi:hypothetical protein E2R58_15100 [Paenibacillus amylolyticus]|uniref:hypothetical protein n=1 Tax=Paenibacillus amylolyticus TaxID=1451 RepID=UPI0010594755|nr:hypothetical protein [Paenibacillus amylolyticus]TDL70407.1 hypothetical protein E2R58_15100 [Paenibacillus amylolyticus]